MATTGTYIAGQIYTASEANNTAPMCVLEATTSVAANGVVIAFGAGSELTDKLNWHSTSSNTSRITPNIAGIYFVSASVQDYGDATRALTAVYKNGANLTYRIQQDISGAETVDDMTIGGYIQCNGTTDYLEIYVLQQSAGAKSMPVQFAAQFIGPAT